MVEILKEELEKLIVDHSQKEIAKMYGCSQATIRRRMVKLGIKSPRIGNCKGGPKEIVCHYCGKKFSHKRWRKRKYCSFECMGNAKYQTSVDAWLSGEDDGVIGKYGGTARFIKRYMIEKYGEECVKCGWAERNKFTNKIPLQLNHKDGNWKNNIPENLELLCPNCHSLTEHFGGRNKGNGRIGRRTWRQNKIEGHTGVAQ